MYIPAVASTAALSTTDLLFTLLKDGNGSESPIRHWSSLIGIITAIIGNILISFALNTQRYAHIRISREHNDAKQSAKEGRTSIGRPPGYGGVEQEDNGEGEENLVTADAQARQQPDGHGDETRPLKASFHSEATLQGSQGDEDDDMEKKSYLKSPYWWAGIVLMTVGEAGNFLAYGFAPASIVSPLGVVALISNCLIAPLMLKERFRRRDLWGVIIAIGGAVTVVLSAKQDEIKFDPDTLLDAIKRWEFLVYVLITVILIITLTVLSPKYGSRTIFVDLGLMALYGGYTALSTKGVASLLSASLYKAFTFPITYFLIAVLIFSAVMQIRYINLALQNYNSTEVIPTQFVLFTLSVIIGSTVLYRDFESTSAERMVKFIAGCLLTFFGVYLITSGRSEEDASIEEMYGDNDRTIRLFEEEESPITERTPLRRPDLQLDSQTSQPTSPVTPDDATIKARRPSEALSMPSISVTPAETESVSNPWVSSTEALPSPSNNQPVRPSTPQTYPSQPDLEATPFFTPATSRKIHRTPSSPAAPESPSPAGRAPSPPKVDKIPYMHPRSARNSISRLLPGPLLPPLSSSLSAVVADSLLRGEGSPRSIRETLRHRRSLRDRQRSLVQGDEDEGSSADNQLSRDLSPSPRTRLDDGEDDNSSHRGKLNRLRAMSESLTGIISGNKRRKKDDEPPSRRYDSVT